MFGWLCMFPIPGVVAVILGFVALGQIRREPHSTGKGLAIAGIILGGINFAFILLWIIWFILTAVFG